MTTVPWQGRSPTRSARWLTWSLTALALLLIALYPLAQNYLRAASLLRTHRRP